MPHVLRRDLELSEQAFYLVSFGAFPLSAYPGALADDQFNGHGEVAVFPVADVIEPHVVHDFSAVTLRNSHGDHLNQLVNRLINRFMG